MNKLILITFFSLCAYNVNSQQVVIDPGVITALTVNHTIQNGTLNEIEQEENGIKNLQATINVKLLQIKALQQKTYNSLKQVQSVVQQGKNVIYASTVAVDIGEYQAQMLENAEGNVILYAIALKTELALINRTYDMFLYITTALTGGDINLMSNMERMKIINHVVEELRVMRGLAYSINRKIRTAKYSGQFRALLQEFDISLMGFNEINRLGIIQDVMPQN